MPRDTSAYGNRFMFTGREFDSETGNYYYRARYYSPVIGRFLSADPIGYYDSLNLYEYCWNNPTNFVDPYGYFGAAAGAIGAGSFAGAGAVTTGAATVGAAAVVGYAGYTVGGWIGEKTGFSDAAAEAMASVWAWWETRDNDKDKDCDRGHSKGARESTRGKHEKGQRRLKKDKGGEKGDLHRPYRR